MSETPSLWRSPTSSLFSPQMMVGAATPLWGYFTGAALTGVALWWMSRWAPTAAAPVAAAPEPVAVPAAKVPTLFVVEPVAEPIEEPVVEPVEEPIIEAEFVESPPRPRRSKPVEVKPH